MATYEELIEALRRADAAGDVEAAKAIARRAAVVKGLAMTTPKVTRPAPDRPTPAVPDAPPAPSGFTDQIAALMGPPVQQTATGPRVVAPQVPQRPPQWIADALANPPAPPPMVPVAPPAPAAAPLDMIATAMGMQPARPAPVPGAPQWITDALANPPAPDQTPLGEALLTEIGNAPERVERGFRGNALIEAERGMVTALDAAGRGKNIERDLEALRQKRRDLEQSFLTAPADQRISIQTTMQRLRQEEDRLSRALETPGFGAAVTDQARADLESYQRDRAAQQTEIDALDEAIVPTKPAAGLDQAVVSGIASLADMSPGLAATLITKNPLPMMAYLGLYSRGSTYADKRREGFDSEKSLTAANLYAAAEAIPEYLPLHVILKEGVGAVSKIAGGAVTEAASEALTSALQQLIDQGVLDQNMTWDQAVVEMRQSAAAGGVMGAFMGGLGAGADAGRRAWNRRREEEDTPANPNAAGYNSGTTPPPPAQPPAAPMDQIAGAMAPPAAAQAPTIPGAQAAPQAPAAAPAQPVDPMAQIGAAMAPPPVAPPAPAQGATAQPMTRAEVEANPDRFEVLDESEGQGADWRATGGQVVLDKETGRVFPLAPDTAAGAAPVAGAPGGADSAGQPQEVRAEAPPAAGPAPEAQVVAAAGGTVPPAPASMPNQPRNFEFIDAAGVQNIGTQPDVMQYKAGGDAEGVTDRLRGVTEWRPERAGMSIIYEYADGRRVIADGHQRLGLAKRLAGEGKRIQMPAMILREADGVTPRQARVTAALKNIAEGSGTALDAAKVLRESTETVEQMGLPPNSAIVRDAQGMRNLSDVAFGMVANGVASERDGGIVGRIVTNKEAQANILALLARLQKDRPMTAFQAESVAGQAAADTVTQTQDSLFGPETDTQNLYLERAKILEAALRIAREDERAFGNVVRNAERLQAAGNQLDADGNKAVVDKAGALRDYLTREANTKGAISEALTAAARALNGGASISAATRQFLDAVERGLEARGSGRTGGDQGGQEAGSNRPQEPGDQGLNPDDRDESAAAGDLFGAAPAPAPDPQADILAAMQGQAARPEAQAQPEAQAPAAKPADTSRKHFLDAINAIVKPENRDGDVDFTSEKGSVFVNADGDRTRVTVQTFRKTKIRGEWATEERSKTYDFSDISDDLTAEARAQIEAIIAADQAESAAPDAQPGAAPAPSNWLDTGATGKTPEQIRAEAEAKVRADQSKMRKPGGNTGDAGPLFNPDQDLFDQPKAAQDTGADLIRQGRAILQQYSNADDARLFQTNSIDLRDQPAGQRLADDLAKAKTPEARQKIADAWVLEQGKRSGLEHIVVLDAAGIPLAINSGGQDWVSVHPEVLRAADAGVAAYATHNHPQSTTHSPGDVAMLFAGFRSVVVMGHDGKRHMLSAVPGVTVNWDGQREYGVPSTIGLTSVLSDVRALASETLQRHYSSKPNMEYSERGAAFGRASSALFPAFLDRLGIVRYDQAQAATDFLTAEGINLEEIHGQVSSDGLNRLRRAGLVISEGAGARGNRPADQGAGTAPPATDGADQRTEPDATSGEGVTPAKTGNADLDGALDDLFGDESDVSGTGNDLERGGRDGTAADGVGPADVPPAGNGSDGRDQRGNRAGQGRDGQPGAGGGVPDGNAPPVGAGSNTQPDGQDGADGGVSAGGNGGRRNSGGGRRPSSKPGRGANAAGNASGSPTKLTPAERLAAIRNVLKEDLLDYVAGPDGRDAEAREFAAQLKQELGLRDLSLFVSNGGDLRLNMIAVPRDAQGQGVGTEAMRQIIDFADERGLRITLAVGQPDDGFGTTSRARLVRFYKRFGFVENTGRNKDFALSPGMYRNPRRNGFNEDSANLIDPRKAEALQAIFVDALDGVDVAQSTDRQLFASIILPLKDAGMTRAEVAELSPYLTAFLGDLRAGRVSRNPDPAPTALDRLNAVVPGWTAMNGMLTNSDPERGGIIDKAILGKKWFVVLNGSTRSTDGLDTVDQAVDWFIQNHKAPAKPKAEPRVIPGDRDNIDKTLPLLLPEQRDDVFKIETRFAKPDGHGFMLTNGTGTGKTYSGGGAIKRFYQQGKKNILIIAPDATHGGWQRTLDALGVPSSRLADTKDAGEGVVFTTHQNVGANDALASRQWDLVVVDEAQFLAQNKDGAPTATLTTLRAITHRPQDLWRKSQMRHAQDWAKLKAMKDGEAKTALYRKLKEREDREVQAMAQQPRSKVLFLSATPFAYDKTIDYAEGYLFTYPADGTIGNSRQGGREKFFVENFGYRIRYHKLTKPEHAVDSAVFEREYHEKLKRDGVLSGRSLQVDVDYDRRFVTVADAIGTEIDAILKTMSEGQSNPDKAIAAGYQTLNRLMRDTFGYLERMQLLEAIKGRAAVEDIRKHLALGRKVVVFHDFNKGGGFNPFAALALYKNMDDANAIAALADLIGKHPNIQNLNFSGYPAPATGLKAAFGNRAGVFSGLTKKDRDDQLKAFNTDGSGVDVLIVQADAGGAGVSMHDLTGTHQRVLINLGMPTKPTTTLQQEGRILRVGTQTNAAFRYYTIGTAWEREAFAKRIAERSGTVENLALGNEARAITEAFVDAYMEAETFDPSDADGKGGKERDRSKNVTTPWQRAISYYFGRMKTTGRRDQRQGLDFYPTPEPLGLKMVEWAGIRTNERVLEPSAGDGAIARFMPDDASLTIVEPSNDLGSTALLRAPRANLAAMTFEQHHISNKYHAIVMNPPFGAGGKTAMEHLAKAAKHLRPGGRIVALIPSGPSADKRFEAWWSGDDAKGLSLSAEVTLPAVTFERAGTGVMSRVVIIDKLADGQEVGLGARSVDLRSISTTKDLFDRLEDMQVARRPAPTQDVLTELEAEGQDATTPPANTRPGPAVAGGLQFKLAQTKHAKTGKDLFVASIANRVDREAYLAVLAVAKDHGGYYSSFRGNGAIPGFQFPTEAARQAFLDDVQKPTANGEAANPGGFEETAYHGTPHDFDGFSLEAIGTGEGAQAYGWGLYFAGRRSVAEWYRDKLSRASLQISGEDVPNFLLGSMSPEIMAQTEQYIAERGAPEKPAEVSAEAWRSGAVLFPYALRRTVTNLRDKIFASPTDDVQNRLRIYRDTVLGQYQNAQARNFPPDMAELAADLASIDWLAARASKTNPGSLFTVDIPGPDTVLDWDARLVDQPEQVRKIIDRRLRKRVERGLAELRKKIPDGYPADVDDLTGSDIYDALASAEKMSNPNGYAIRYLRYFHRNASERLRAAGIPGHRYLDGSSRGAGEGSHNYVIYDESAIQIIAKEQRAQMVREAAASTEEIRRLMPALRAELDRLDLKRVRLSMREGQGDWQGAIVITGDGEIEIVIGASLDPMKTLHHEVIHALRAMNLFTPEEWRALSLAAERSWIKKHDIEGRYPHLTREEQIEEAIAEEFTEALAKREAPKGSALITAFNKIARIFRAIRNVLNGAGYQTAEDIFGRVLSGEISARQAGNTGARVGMREQEGASITRNDVPDDTTLQTVRITGEIPQDQVKARTRAGLDAIIGKPLQTADGTQVEITGKSAGKLGVFPKGDWQARALVAANLERVLRSAVIYGSAPDSDGRGTLAWQYAVAHVSINGEPAVVRASLRQVVSEGRNIAYDLQGFEIERLAVSNADGAQAGQANQPPSSRSITLSQALSAIKAGVRRFQRKGRDTDTGDLFAQPEPARPSGMTADQRRELEARQRQSKMRKAGGNSGDAGPLFNDDRDLFGERTLFQRPPLAVRPLTPQGRAHRNSALGATPFIPDRRVWESLTAAGVPIWQRLRDLPGAASDAVDRARFTIQDRFLPFLRAQEAVMRQTGRPLPKEHDAYLAETTFSGKVGRHLLDVDERFTKPIIQIIAASKGRMDADTVGEYLYARHAIERNAYIASINLNMPDGGSGITDADAQAILAQVAASPDAAAYAQIGQLVDQMREWGLTLRENAGLISNQEAQMWRTQYRHYVPLKGFEETDHAESVMDLAGVRTGRRFSIRGGESRRALGRRSEAFNPLQSAITQAQEVAIRAEKNRVAQSMYELAKNYPSKALWDVKKPAQKRYFNRSTGLVETRVENPVTMRLEPNEMAVKIDGKEHRILFNDQRLAEAAGTLGADQMSGVLRVLSILSRFFSMTRTMLNPEFMITNAFRDFQTAQFNIQAFGEGDKARIAKAMAKNWRKAFMGAMRGSTYRFDTEWSRYFNEFQKSGAQVWFWTMEQPEAAREDLGQRVALARGNRAQRALKLMTTPSAIFSFRDNPALAYVERVNLAVDNAIRLAAFVEARKAGWDVEKAAFLAKELTVNFNRRGEAGATMNALYPFFNAAIQGTVRTVKAISSRRVAAMVATAFAGGVLLDLANAALSEEDDDGELFYDKVPNWRNERNLHLVLWGTGDNPFAIPMPYGYNVFPYAGQQLGKVLRGVKDPDRAFGDVMTAIFGAYSPISAATPAQMVSPFISDPIVEMAENQNWLGIPIYPQTFGNQTEPDSYVHFRGASEVSKWVAQSLNSLTGGDFREPGAIDVSPETLDHLASFVMGSAGAFWGRGTDIVAKALQGDFESIEGRNVPFLRNVTSPVGEWADRDRYYRFGAEVKNARADAKAYAEAGRPVPAKTQALAGLYDAWLLAERERGLKGEWNPSKTGALAAREESKVFLDFNRKYLSVMGKQGE